MPVSSSFALACLRGVAPPPPPQPQKQANKQTKTLKNKTKLPHTNRKWCHHPPTHPTPPPTAVILSLFSVFRMSFSFCFFKLADHKNVGLLCCHLLTVLCFLTFLGPFFFFLRFLFRKFPVLILSFCQCSFCHFFVFFFFKHFWCM